MRSLTVAAFLIAAGFGPAALAGEWMTDSKSGCRMWDPLPVPDEAVSWRGPCKDGKASGSGVLTIFKAGAQVEHNEGEFADGKETGHGVRRNPDGRYVGNFKDGLFDGSGLYVAANGMRYDGEWRNGNIEGRGKLSFSSGLRYEGQFRANTYNGFGSMIFPNGARYDGEYLLSTPHGTGVYRAPNGTTYAGQWTHGCFDDGSRTARLGVVAEDCGLSEDAAVARAPSSEPRREN